MAAHIRLPASTPLCGASTAVRFVPTMHPVSQHGGIKPDHVPNANGRYLLPPCPSLNGRLGYGQQLGEFGNIQRFGSFPQFRQN
jgi:hypothetical protein